MKRKLVYHRGFRVSTIYDGSIRRPRTGADDNKSVGLKLTPWQGWSLVTGLTKYLLFTFAYNCFKRNEPLPDLTITAYKYNKGPRGHHGTLTSSVLK